MHHHFRADFEQTKLMMKLKQNKFSSDGPNNSIINILYVELYPNVFISGIPNAFI